jgi:hypothetical protein
MRKMLVAIALASVSLTIPAATPTVRQADSAAFIPGPTEPVCIVILGKKICW